MNKFFLLIIAALSLASCTESQITEIDTIASNHTYGDVSRGDTFSMRPKMSGCEKYPFEASVTQSIYPHYYVIANDLLSALYEANEVAMLDAGYDKSDLCISIYNSQNVNAHVAPGSDKDGIIYMSEGLFNNSGTVGEIAGVLAHELAHLTMNHHGYQIPKHEDVTKDPLYFEHFGTLKKVEALVDQQRSLLNDLKRMTRYRRLKVALETLQGSFRYNFTIPLYEALKHFTYDDLKREFGEMLLYYDSLALENNYLSFRLRVSERKLKNKLRRHFGDNHYSAWKEIEADEVGLEFFVKAGFKKAEFNWIHRHFIHLNKRKVEDCPGFTDEDEVPLADSSHPTSCWRIYNNNKELEEHKKEYDKHPEDFYGDEEKS